MALINSGNLDREVTVQRVSISQSDSGMQVKTWGGDVTVWAEWLPAGTREAWQAQQRLSSYVDGVLVTYDMTPRPMPETTRILFDGRIFDVKGWTEIGRKEGLEIAVVAAGEL